MERVQQIDPTWQRPTSAYAGIEGAIAHEQSVARAANERYSDIQASGFGGNRVPQGEPLPPLQPVRPPTWNENAARQIDRLFPYGGATDQMDRLLEFGRDREKGDWSINEIGTAVRLERELGRTLFRSDQPGSDFIDRFGQTWDAIGSDWRDAWFNFDRFSARIERKINNDAADRYVVDLSGLNVFNAAQIEAYIRSLPVHQRHRIRIVR